MLPLSKLVHLSRMNVVFLLSLLSVSGTQTLSGATFVRSLKLPKELWATVRH
jgi:hypothetical protein